MGSSNSSSEEQGISRINIATLNYSGILLSPYQFYEKQDKLEIRLNRIMKDAVDQMRDHFNEVIDLRASEMKAIFDVGPFDTEWQASRFSPLYRASCGVRDNLHMMGKSEFLAQWEACRKNNQKFIDQVYRLKKKHAPGSKTLEQQQQQKNQYLKNLKAFDLCAYKALLLFVYPDQQKHIQQCFDADRKLTLKAGPYRQHQIYKFSKPFLWEQQKISKTIQALKKQKIDILFIQEATEQLAQSLFKRLNHYRIVAAYDYNGKMLKNKNMIIINEVTFPKIRSLDEENSRLYNNIECLLDPLAVPDYLTKQDISEIKSWGDQHLVIQFVYNLILMSVHLSSTKKNNIQQMKKVTECIQFLKCKFPTCYIILGGDLNNKNFTNQALAQMDGVSFSVVPDCKQYSTTYKKRTQLQVQTRKADVLDCAAKDYLMSDLKVISSDVVQIDGKSVMNLNRMSQLQNIRNSWVDPEKEVTENYKPPFLPSESHPFDHYIVKASLEIPKGGLEHITDFSYISRYTPNKLKPHQIRMLDLQKNMASKQSSRPLKKQKKPSSFMSRFCELLSFSKQKPYVHEQSITRQTLQKSSNITNL